MLYTKYQGSRSCDFRQEDSFMFSLYKPYGMKNLRPMGRGHNLNKLGRGPLGDATYQISRLYALHIQGDSSYRLIFTFSL